MQSTPSKLLFRIINAGWICDWISSGINYDENCPKSCETNEKWKRPWNSLNETLEKCQLKLVTGTLPTAHMTPRLVLCWARSELCLFEKHANFPAIMNHWVTRFPRHSSSHVPFNENGKRRMRAKNEWTNKEKRPRKLMEMRPKDSDLSKCIFNELKILNDSKMHVQVRHSTKTKWNER